MFNRIKKLKRLVQVLAIAAAAAAVMPPAANSASVCAAADHWSTCAKKVKTAIKNTNDATTALAAASEWSERFRALYKANPQSAWTLTDEEKFEAGMEALWDELVGQYLNPATFAFGLALKKYFPTLAAALEWAGSGYVTAFVLLVAPSPVANDFQEARSDNKEINDLLKAKLPTSITQNVLSRYPELFRKGYEAAKGEHTLP
ncbi:hypothetical protein [Bradyrhizobium symbiodeficiens]|uniref:hypothetical protein n=1 Tax=Bradyrhizobium symbiodeficiens TaxID=1404367 RepID=UPI0011E4CF9B|nr:hypothetical protein [Bradyrhizobium symbiodeficiens]